MKKTTLLAAAAALLMASPAIANTGGSVGLGYTNTDDGITEGSTYQLDGVFGGTNGPVGFQVDAGLANSDDADSQTIAGHLYWKTDNLRIGGVIARADVDSNLETAYGVEGTLDLGPNAVAFGSYSVGETELFTLDLDTKNADVGLNYYFSDNLRVGGSYGAGNLDAGAGDVDFNTYRIDGEWQPWSAPVSFTLGWNSVDLEDFSYSVDSWTVGVRYNWGGSLRERDNATPFDTRAPLLQRLFDLR